MRNDTNAVLRESAQVQDGRDDQVRLFYEHLPHEGHVLFHWKEAIRDQGVLLLDLARPG